MTSEDYETFIQRSFCKMDLPKPKINLGTSGKYAIVALFYSFYQKSLNEDWNNERSKAKIIELLKDAFDTTKFNNLPNHNFKDKKSKYYW